MRPYVRYAGIGSTGLTQPQCKKCRIAGAHARIKRQWGPAKGYTCIECGKQAEEWAYDGTDPSQKLGKHGAHRTAMLYSVYPEFYMPMCRSCHKTRDRGVATAELLEYREWKIRHKSTVTAIDEMFDNINAAAGKILEIDFDAIYERARQAPPEQMTA